MPSNSSIRIRFASDDGDEKPDVGPTQIDEVADGDGVRLLRERIYAQARPLTAAGVLLAVLGLGAFFSLSHGGDEQSAFIRIPQQRSTAVAPISGPSPLEISGLENVGSPESLGSEATKDSLEDLVAPKPQAILEAPEQAGQMRMEEPSSRAAPTLIFDSGGLSPPIDGSRDLRPDKGEGQQGQVKTADSSEVQTLLLTQGTLIPGVLETPIDPKNAGGVRATVSTDIRSRDGTRVLVARSSRFVGSYAIDSSGKTKRVLVIWTSLLRPDGSSVPIASSRSSAETIAKSFGQSEIVSVIGVGAGRNSQSRIRPGEPIRIFARRDVRLKPD